MTIFLLPDLGEGLPEAEIREWYVKVGDSVIEDQPLLSMESAKAVVDIPSPQAGIVSKIHGNEGDVIATGAPLVEFIVKQSEKNENNIEQQYSHKASQTVVGELDEAATISSAKHNIMPDAENSYINKNNILNASPAVRALAKNLDIDLNKVTPTGIHNTITLQDVTKLHELENNSIKQNSLLKRDENTINNFEQKFAKLAMQKDNFIEQKLNIAQKYMSHLMQQSQNEIVHTTVCDEADIGHWQNEDITVRLIQALIYAVTKEPRLNAWFDNNNDRLIQFKPINLGLAYEYKSELFVPVISNCQNLTATQLRQQITNIKHQIEQRSLPLESLNSQSITLSNFGTFAGRFATPIITPPTVSILACGKIYSKVVASNEQNKFVSSQHIPLSLSFDHRVITGGEAARFLSYVIESLIK